MFLGGLFIYIYRYVIYIYIWNEEINEKEMLGKLLFFLYVEFDVLWGI